MENKKDKFNEIPAVMELADDKLDQVTGGTERQLFRAVNQLLQQSIERQNCIGQNIIGQNIANATSEGYSRQQVNQSFLSPELRTYQKEEVELQ